MLEPARFAQKAAGALKRAFEGYAWVLICVLLFSPCPIPAQNQGQIAARLPRKVFAARAVGKYGFAGPGDVRGPPRATATAKTAYIWLARPAMAKATFRSQLRSFTMTAHQATACPTLHVDT